MNSVYTLAIGAMLVGGCTAIAGLDNNYVVDGAAAAEEAAVSTSGTGGSGQGGEGGAAPTCIGVEGTGLGATSCDKMNITPISKGGSAAEVCDEMGGISGTNPPPGYASCQYGFEVFTAGPAEYFQKCLAEIGVEPADACSFEPLQKCVNDMYPITCAVEETTKKCEGFAAACQGAGQDFDAAGCAVDLTPFNMKALGDYEDCINNADPMLTCEQAHQRCFERQLPAHYALCVAAGGGGVCGACTCSKCADEVSACNKDMGCTEIRKCAQENMCTGAGCIGPCGAVINMYGGIMGMSAQLASTLFACVDQNCQMQCQ